MKKASEISGTKGNHVMCHTMILYKQRYKPIVRTGLPFSEAINFPEKDKNACEKYLCEKLFQAAIFDSSHKISKLSPTKHEAKYDL